MGSEATSAPARATTSAPHPAIDRANGAVIVSETRAEVAYLSVARADLIVAAHAAGKHLVLVSDEMTRLTAPLREALLDSGGYWVVREAGGTLRDGLDGRRLASITAAVSTGPASRSHDVAPRFLRPAPADAVHLVVSQTVWHPAIETALLGGAAEQLAARLTGSAPTAWGTNEPAVAGWDRARLTEFILDRLPDETSVTITGPAARPMIGTIRVVRTAKVWEETTALVLYAGSPDSSDARDALDRLPRMFSAVAAAKMPVCGLVMARTGRHDLTLPSVLEAPLAPLAPLGMLIGATWVRELGLDVDLLTTGTNARIVGSRRDPGLYLPLADGDRVDWRAFDALLRVLGPDRARFVLGSAAAHLDGAQRAS